MPARIVVIEDDAASLELIDSLLAERGYIPLPVSGGQAGLRMALLVRPDLILLDADAIRLELRMPGIKGHEVAAAIKSQPGLERTMIIAMTDSAAEGERARLAAAGFDGHLHKPIDPAQLIDEVERVLHTPHPA